MKKLYFFLLSLLTIVNASAQTLFTETFGSPAGTTAITAYTGWSNPSLTFTDGGAPGAADIRSTSASNATAVTYTGASGGGNVFFTSTAPDRGFAIENINASAATNLTLQFGYRKESGTVLPTLTVDYWNGTAWVNVPFTFNEVATAAVGWYLSPVLSLPAAAQINGLKLRWVRGGSQSGRIDDVVLAAGSGSSATITVTGTPVPDFGSVTVGTQSASATIQISGANLTGAPGTLTITAPSTDFQVSSDNTNFGPTATIPYTSATLAATPAYIRFTPQTAGVKTGNVTITGGGSATGATVSVTGTGAAIPVPAAPVATAATGVSGNSFTANWNASSGATGYFLDVYTQATGTVTGGTVAQWTMPAGNTSPNFTNRFADAGTAVNIGNDSLVAVLAPATPVYSTPAGYSSTAGGLGFSSIGTSGWNDGQDAKYWMININTTGVTNLTLSSGQGSSNTGPKNFKVQYSIGASGTWTDVPGGVVSIPAAPVAGNPATFGMLTDLPLPAAAENQPLVYIRWIMTDNVSVNNGTVASGGTSRISGIQVKGNYTGNVITYVPGFQNLNVNNVTSFNVTGLSPNTTYYYVVRATNAGGTSSNSNEISVTTTAASATLTAGTLAAFGAVCVNSTATPLSFTLNGSNLTGDVTVGPLAGYAFSTTSGGTYASTLTLTPASGSISQTVFVQFTPTSAASFNGNIPVSGGGATAVNVAASGTGVNTAPSVTTGTATGITTTAATLAGTITANGCSNPTAYGIIWSTTSGFNPATAGTSVAGSNLASGAFSVNLTGLSANTAYYYVAFATNAGGTSYGTQQQFTTLAQPVLSTGTLADFGNQCVNTTSTPLSFTLNGSNLSNADITVGPLAGFAFSTTSGGTYTPTLTLTQAGGTYSQTVFVQFTPVTVGVISGNIPVSGGGATAINVAASGTAINTPASVSTGNASGISTTGATLPGTITATGCSNVTAYGFVWSTTSGFNPASQGTTVTASNLAGGNFSSTLTGLTPNTTYYYVAFATNGGGTTYGVQQQFTTSSNPSLSAGTLNAFGNQCVNTTSAPLSFTLNGSNLTGDVTVNALAGYTFSTSAAGTYTPTLTLTPVSGGLSQTVFVRFTPTAVQSYSGNISISGGGATAVNVAASGDGINTIPAVNTGAATAVTFSGATVAGSITANGCSNVTAYGIIWSTTNGFNPATTGTNVAGSNITSGTYSVALSGLNASTTYYYVAYATNAGGTAYGSQQSFTTSASPAITATALSGFGDVCVNTPSAPLSFTINGTALAAGDITVGPLAGYTFSTTSGGTFTNSLTIPQTGGSFSQQVFVRLVPTAVQSFSGNIPVSGGGATAINVAATGAGVNTPATVTTAAATGVSATTASIPGSITANGCSNVTAYGVIWSTTNGFNPSTTGTNVAGTNLAAGNFSVGLTGLTAATTYYYVTYATNAGGTSYSAQQSFTTSTLATPPAAPVATAATAVTGTGFTANWNAVTGATGYFLDVYTLSSGSSVVAGWDMAVNTAAGATANQGNANNTGIQQLSANTGVALVYTSGGISGTTGTPNPYSVSTSGWNAGVGTKFWQIDLNTTGATNLTLSFNQGSSGSGPKEFKLQYRVGAAGTWTDIPGGTVTMPGVAQVPATPATWAVVSNLALPAAMENQAQVSIRWLLNSDTRNDGATGGIASTGTNRLSGIYVRAASGSPTPVYVTGYQNLNVGNVTSFNVTGLTPNTTYYYVVRATNAAGTSANSNEITVNTLAAPALTATTLTGFGNVCVNVASTAQSFTINGANLTAGDITVGPLAGYTFSTTSGGTYTNTLTIPTTGGTFSQQVFVRLTPTAVQSFSGNIPVSGGGASAINVAATGAGVNTAPTVTAGAANGITGTSAPLPGSITANGCSNVTAYGVIWSTANGFDPATTGTNVAGTNLATGNFSVNLTGLTAATTYYYVTYATNAGGTSYSAQQSFATTAGGTPPVAPVATAATAITGTGFTANWNAVTGATGYFLDVYTLGSGSGNSVIAGWDMATNTSVAAASTANQGNANNINIQQLSTNTGGAVSTPSGFSGTSGTPNPYAVSSNGWDAGVGIKAWQINVNTTGQTGLTLSFNQGSSASGPKEFKLQYRIGAAGTWTDIPNGTVSMPGVAVAPANAATWASVTNLPLPTAVENQADVAIRWLLNADTRNDGLAGSIPNTGTNRLSGIYVRAASGTPTPVFVSGYQNLNVGNVTSFNVTGLQPNTTYYYVVRATNASGTSPNSNEISVTTLAAPVLTATTLSTFGNVCVNTPAAPLSFTVNGTALTAGDITVGPLAGYTFSTTSGGTYTNTLTIPQTGGSFSQQVFVRLTPTTVQAFNGDIPVSGGGAAAINVAATGAGVNTAPAVTTGAAANITNISATLPGTITNNGCSNVTAYGIIWSTTNGFNPATSGTNVAGTNLAGSGFSINLSGLTAATTYYYVAYATNAGGTTYGAQQQFTTAAGPIVSLSATQPGSFGSVCVGTAATPLAFTITGVNLTSAPVTVGPASGFTFATTAAGPFTPSLSLTQPGGAFSQQVFVQFTPTAAGAVNANIPVGGGGATGIFNVTGSGTGVATPPGASTLDSTAISFDRVTLRGRIDSIGCSNVIEHGIEYSAIPNFTGGTGTRVPSANLAGGSFSATAPNLIPGTTYYYRAYARNGGAIGYGAVKSVTLPGLMAGLRVFPMPVSAGQSVRVTFPGLRPGNYSIVLYSRTGEQVYIRNVNVQASFLNEQIYLPSHLSAGVYILRVVGIADVIGHQRIMISN